MHQEDKDKYQKKFTDIKLAYEQILDENKEMFNDYNNNSKSNVDYDKQRQQN